MFESTLAHLAIAQHANGHILKNVQKNEAVKELAETFLKPSGSQNVVEMNNRIKFIPPLQQKVPEVQHQIQNFPVDVDGIAVAQRSSHYSRKKNSTSFLVQFSEEGSVYFGKVEYYVRNSDDGFAVVNLFRNLQLNVSEINIVHPEDPVLKEFWSAGYLGCHHTSNCFC